MNKKHVSSVLPPGQNKIPQKKPTINMCLYFLFCVFLTWWQNRHAFVWSPAAHILWVCYGCYTCNTTKERVYYTVGCNYSMTKNIIIMFLFFVGGSLISLGEANCSHCHCRDGGWIQIKKLIIKARLRNVSRCILVQVLLPANSDSAWVRLADWLWLSNGKLQVWFIFAWK